MKLIHSLNEMQALSKTWVAEQSIGFVPTMGYLHAGHLSLVEASTSHCQVTVVSIYINPSQFGANEDLSSYPRDIKKDLELLNSYKVDYVFCPSSEEMYPEGFHTWVNVEEISSVLCGASRPGHFRGVATVVLKLINIVKPNLMFMGEKDFQQVAVLQAMLKDLNLHTRIIPCPIVREADGLAMSSRNSYLNQTEREQALCLSQALAAARDLYAEGIREAAILRIKAEQFITGKGGRVDYISFVNSATLKDEATVNVASRMILAVYIGKTRLIDNGALSQ